MTEQQIQSKIIKALEARGAYVVKVIAASKKGVPDILCCYLGELIAFEVKRPGKEKNTTELQKYNIAKIKQAGGRAYVVSSVDDVIGILQDVQT